MTSQLTDMTLKAIGTVRNKVKQAPGPGYDWRGITSEIVVNSCLTEALDRLEECSHIIVLYWMHQVAHSSELSLKVHPRGKAE